ncbi:hypothetical protein [Streptomyces sp. NPDC058279]|uniref:hypothetical protein n=1 Tax=Streptomyces sp. NPDC058279 TaxID=3346418 RepID=UPI0036E5E005
MTGDADVSIIGANVLRLTLGIRLAEAGLRVRVRGQESDRTALTGDEWTSWGGGSAGLPTGYRAWSDHTETVLTQLAGRPGETGVHAKVVHVPTYRRYLERRFREAGGKLERFDAQNADGGEPAVVDCVGMDVPAADPARESSPGIRLEAGMRGERQLWMDYPMPTGSAVRLSWGSAGQAAELLC